MISYQLPVASHVRLVLYDMVGREIATLVNGVEDAGYKSVQWDVRLPGLPAGQAGGQGSNLSSSVYFYRLQARQINGGQAGDFIQTRKLLLLK